MSAPLTHPLYPPAGLLCPVDQGLMRAPPPSPPSTAPILRKLLRGTEALIDWRPGRQDASIIIISTSAAAGGLAGGGRG